MHCANEVLADNLLAVGETDAARECIQALALCDHPAARARAHLKLARFALSAGKPGECLAACRGLTELSGADREEVLTLMGRAYEASGDSRRAAECFAGKYPRD